MRAMKLQYSYVLIALSPAVRAESRRWSNGTNTNTTGSPCAIVSSSAAAVLATSPLGKIKLLRLQASYSLRPATPVVNAQLAYDCLNSVALNASAATKLVEAILPFVQFQSGIIAQT